MSLRQAALEKQYHLPPQTIADEHCVGKNTGEPACKPTYFADVDCIGRSIEAPFTWRHPLAQ